ncbi:restriction endonuclease, partial [Acinetobacter baumannii]
RLYMAIIDFKEIPPAHGNGDEGLRDSFELFAEEFFKSLGFTIIEGPSRGADNGKDLIVEENIQGIFDQSATSVRWLVSCKHKAHSGNSVAPADELNLIEKLTAHRCNGFIGFYSTLASTGLDTLITGIRNSNYRTRVLNAENIESILLESKSGISLIERFFPESFNRWRAENPVKAKIFSDDEFPLKCMVCGNNLVINNKMHGNLYTIKKVNDLNSIVAFKWSCSGECDKAINPPENFKLHGLIEYFDHIENKATPTTFLLFVLDIIRDMQNGMGMLSEEAFKDLQYFLCAIYPYVTRNMTTRESEILGMDLMCRNIG